MESVNCWFFLLFVCSLLLVTWSAPSANNNTSPVTPGAQEVTQAAGKRPGEVGDDRKKDALEVDDKNIEHNNNEHTEVTEHNEHNAWKQFKNSFNKQYTDNNKDNYRRQILESNMKRVSDINQRAKYQHWTFKLAINEYSDLTVDEYRNRFLGLKVPARERSKVLKSAAGKDVVDDDNDELPLSSTAAAAAGDDDVKSRSKRQIPENFDWRLKGYVSPVKNQGSCGACWAFATAGALEGQIYRRTGKLFSLSEQNLIDCSWQYGNNGCGGGWMTLAYRYVQAVGNLDTDSVYPYNSANNAVCSFNSSATAAGQCTGFRYVWPDEYSLKRAVSVNGPIAVSIDANRESFFYYGQGIYNDPSCTSNVNHAVLVVGYGTENGQDYWIVKNSWGSSWGEGGYVRMARNNDNLCGIANFATYPLVTAT